MGFLGENFRGLLARTAYCPPSLQTFAEKTFTDRYKAKFTKVFSLESFQFEVSHSKKTEYPLPNTCIYTSNTSDHAVGVVASIKHGLKHDQIWPDQREFASAGPGPESPESSVGICCTFTNRTKDLM